MTDNINNELEAGGSDDQEPMARGFLSPEEIEERVAAFRAALLRLDQDPAEAARIDMLIAGANAMFGDALTPFEDPPAARPGSDDLRQEGRVVINGSHAQPRIEIDNVGTDSTGPGFSLVINGDHAEPRIHLNGNQVDQEVGQLSEEVEELQQEIASLRVRAEERSARKAPRMRGPGPSALAVLGLASAAIAVHSIAVVHVIAITILAAAPVLLLAIVTAAIFSGRDARREAALYVLRLLMNRDPHPEDPPVEGRSGRHLALSGREAEGVDQ